MGRNRVYVCACTGVTRRTLSLNAVIPVRRTDSHAQEVPVVGFTGTPTFGTPGSRRDGGSLILKLPGPR